MILDCLFVFCCFSARQDSTILPKILSKFSKHKLFSSTCLVNYDALKYFMKWMMGWEQPWKVISGSILSDDGKNCHQIRLIFQTWWTCSLDPLNPTIFLNIIYFRSRKSQGSPLENSMEVCRVILYENIGEWLVCPVGKNFWNDVNNLDISAINELQNKTKIVRFHTTFSFLQSFPWNLEK